MYLPSNFGFSFDPYWVALKINILHIECQNITKTSLQICFGLRPHMLYYYHNERSKIQIQNISVTHWHQRHALSLVRK